MLAMQLNQPAAMEWNPLVPSSIRVPSPGPGDLLLRVEACAVCRTDLQEVEGDLAARRLPVVPGHQAVGIVEAVGEGVTGWTVGARGGIAWLAGACGECTFCRDGRENLCLRAEFTGWDRDGGYAEYVTARAAFAIPLPKEPSAQDMAPLLCGGVIGYRSLIRSGIRRGGRLGLFGYGASAHLAIQVARHWGCEVYVYTRSPAEQERALRTGAAWAGSYADSPGVLLDAAVTFAPSGDVVIAALRQVDRGGVVAINAIHLDRMPEFPYEALWWERELRSVANFTRHDAREFMQLAVEVPINTDTQAFSLAEANKALRLLKEGGLSGTAVLLPPGT